RRRHTSFSRDWSSDVCSSDLFDTHTVGSQVLTLPADLKYTPPEPQPGNYVDELVDKKLQQLRLVPSGPCTDEEFIRRLTIDITRSEERRGGTKMISHTASDR